MTWQKDPVAKSGIKAKTAQVQSLPSSLSPKASIRHSRKVTIKMLSMTLKNWHMCTQELVNRVKSTWTQKRDET